MLRRIVDPSGSRPSITWDGRDDFGSRVASGLLLADHWGELCVTKETASEWADELLDITRMALSPDKNLRGHYHGAPACLSALLHAQRYDELIELLQASG